MSIASRLDAVRQKMAEAELRSGRRPGSTRLLAVTKTVGPSVVLEALRAGVTDIGENKVQEASAKCPAIGDQARWHLIGHLQANKVRRAVEMFDVIQTIDSLALAERVSRACEDCGKPSLEVLLQVNVDSDGGKFGLEAALVPELARAVSQLPRLHLAGLMTIGELVSTPEQARVTFRRLSELAAIIRGLALPGVDMVELSMGMSGDFEAAIEEGSTMVRVGSAIFGERD